MNHMCSDHHRMKVQRFLSERISSEWDERKRKLKTREKRHKRRSELRGRARQMPPRVRGCVVPPKRWSVLQFIWTHNYWKSETFQSMQEACQRQKFGILCALKFRQRLQRLQCGAVCKQNKRARNWDLVKLSKQQQQQDRLFRPSNVQSLPRNANPLSCVYFKTLHNSSNASKSVSASVKKQSLDPAFLHICTSQRNQLEGAELIRDQCSSDRATFSSVMNLFDPKKVSHVYWFCSHPHTPPEIERSSEACRSINALFLTATTFPVA